jgi:hypothetical protein
MDAKLYVCVVDSKNVFEGEYAEVCEHAKELAKTGAAARVKSLRQFELGSNAALTVDLSKLTMKASVALPVSKGALAAKAALDKFNAAQDKPAARKGMIVDAIAAILKAEKSVFFRMDENKGGVVAPLAIVANALAWAQGAGLIEIDWLIDTSDVQGLTPGRQRKLIEYVAYFQETGKLPYDNGSLAI